MSILYRRNKSTRGFTLIELLVVIAIIGVLASIVLASLNNARRKSRDARRITDIKQIGLALQLYLDGVGAGQFPVGLGGAADCADHQYGLDALVSGGYIPSIPHDPSNAATCYRYASGVINSLRTTFHLTGVLEDSANAALSGDKDCSSDGVNTPNCDASATWAGALSNGNNSVDCVAATGAAGTDQCYDVMP